MGDHQTHWRTWNTIINESVIFQIQLMRISKYTLSWRQISRSNIWCFKLVMSSEIVIIWLTCYAILQCWHTQHCFKNMCIPCPVVVHGYSTRKHVLYSYIVQQANMETEQNDANNDTRSKRLDIGRSMGGWLQETGQWPAFNRDGHPQTWRCPSTARYPMFWLLRLVVLVC